MNLPVPMWLRRSGWRLRRKDDNRTKLTGQQAAVLADYYRKAGKMFQLLGIDLNSKPADTQRLYFPRALDDGEKQ